MTSKQFPSQPESSQAVRTLQIEAAGDPWLGRIKPKIRLMGCWLERAGFAPGDRVQVMCIGPGVIELRLQDTKMVNEVKQPALKQPDLWP